MNLIWYIYSNDIVSGPFSTEGIESGLKENKWSHEALIWWKGQREWVALDVWRSDLKKILEGFKTNIQTTAWYVEHLGTQKGPMNVKELYNFAQMNGIIGSCRVWANGMDKWTSVFEINELANYFGITRRKHPRAPIKGELFVTKTPSTEPLIVHPGSISVGGLGVKGLGTFKTGDDLSLLLKSPLLVEEIKGQATVVYTNIGGYAGLEFKTLLADYENIITDYVKQFKT